MVGEPDPEVPPPSLRNPRSEPPGALGLPGSQPGLPVPWRSGRPCAPSGNSRLSRVSSAGAKPSGGVSPAPPCSGGGGGCPVAAGSHLSRCTRSWAPALPALEAPQGQGPPLQRLTSSSGGGREYGAWRVPGPLTSALCAGGGRRAPGRGGLRPEHPGRQRAGRRQLPVPPAQQA